MFIQIHTLSSYPAALLNRDDSGLAKRLPYGDAERIRVSSQCLKRHWRDADGEWSIKGAGAPLSIRSREIVEREIAPEVLKASPGIDRAMLQAAGDALIKHLYGNGKKVPPPRERQALMLGKPEVAYLTTIVAEAAIQGDPKAAEAHVDAKVGKGDGKLNLNALKALAGDIPAGLEAALFGRMVTSDPRANIDAPVHVAHAFTVHASKVESDYFTVVDDLRKRDDDSGSAGIFDTELTSGTYYGYVVIDVRGLVDNLGGEVALAADIVDRLVHLVATVTPGAKKGSTAPYAYADYVMVEIGDRQPRSLAGAFRKSVPMHGDVAADAATRLADHLASLDRVYGAKGMRHVASTFEGTNGGGRSIASDSTLDEISASAAAAVTASAAGKAA